MNRQELQERKFRSSKIEKHARGTVTKPSEFGELNHPEMLFPGIDEGVDSYIAREAAGLTGILSGGTYFLRQKFRSLTIRRTPAIVTAKEAGPELRKREEMPRPYPARSHTAAVRSSGTRSMTAQPGGTHLHAMARSLPARRVPGIAHRTAVSRRKEAITGQSIADLPV